VKSETIGKQARYTNMMFSGNIISRRLFSGTGLLLKPVNIVKNIHININELSVNYLKKEKYELFKEYDDWIPTKSAINQDRDIVKLKGPRYDKEGNENKLFFTQVLTLKGKAGELSMKFPDFMKIKCIIEDKEYDLLEGLKKKDEQDNGRRTLNLTVPDSTNKIQKSMLVTLSTILSNNIEGVLDGHLAYLRFVGPGCRFILPEDDKTKLILKKGTAYYNSTVPSDVTLELKSPTFLLVKGLDLQRVNVYANSVHNMIKPDPYKGAGIYFNDREYLKKVKSGK